MQDKCPTYYILSLALQLIFLKIQFYTLVVNNLLWCWQFVFDKIILIEIFSLQNVSETIACLEKQIKIKKSKVKLKFLFYYKEVYNIVMRSLNKIS